MTESMTGEEVNRQRLAKATASMESDPIFYLSMIPFWTMDGDKLTEIKLLPVELGIREPKGLRGFPSPVAPEAIFDHLQMCCEPYGTKLAVDGDYIKVIL
jgi:poly-gamma-glutamate synthesis protein (capsule biosynthesis protein)